MRKLTGYRMEIKVRHKDEIIGNCNRRRRVYRRENGTERETNTHIKGEG